MDEKKTVLIVEDEKSIVDILRFNLEKEGYRCVAAYDGEAGLNAALSENPDLILLDVMLPKMIGFDVCRVLREKGNNVPVIILTAREEVRLCPLFRWPCYNVDLYRTSVQVSHSVMSDSLRPHESQHARPPCPSPTPRVHPDPRPSSQCCHPATSSLSSSSPPASNPSQHQSLFQ